MEDRARGGDEGRSARNPHQGGRRAGLGDAPPPRAKDEVVRGGERGVDGIQKATMNIEGAMPRREESFRSGREQQAPAIDVRERVARGIGDGSRTRRLEERAPRQEPYREG